MPAAFTSPCEECEQPAKYTCPSCGAHTCSLPCTKQHKAKSCNNDADTSASNTSSGAQVKPSASSLPARRCLPTKRKAHDFIPLAEYGEQDLLSDYKFLNQVSRVAEQAGRDLLRSRVVRAGARGSVVPLTDAAQSALGAVASATTAPGLRNELPQQPQNQPPTPAHQRLEALKKQLAYRKIPVMFLPENMRRRKLNHSSWRGREKDMAYTVEVKFPFNARSIKAQEKVLEEKPDSDSMLKSQEADQWDKSSFVIPLAPGSASIVNLLGSQVLQKGGIDSKNFTRLGKRRRHNSRDKVQQVSSDIAKELSWSIVDASFWAELGLLPNQDGQTEDPTAESSTLFPPGTHFLIPLFPIKLRNESSLKYLQWYERHGKAAEEEAARRREAGGENEAAGKGGTEAVDPATGERIRDNGWATVQQYRNSSRPPDLSQEHLAYRPGSEHGDPSPLDFWSGYWASYGYGQGAYAYSYGYNQEGGHTFGCQDQPALPVAAAPTPLFSATLLQSLSRKVDSIQQQRNQSQMEPEGDGLVTHAKGQLLSGSAEPGAVLPPSTDNQDNPTVAPSAQAESTSRGQKSALEQPKKTFIEVPSNTGLSIEEVLRKIPWGWGLVEFATVEIWPETEYVEALGKNIIRILPLRDHDVDAGDQPKMAAEEANQQSIAAPASTTAGQGDPSSPEVPPDAPTETTSFSAQFKTMTRAGSSSGTHVSKGRSAVVTLVSYGSSDEDEDDGSDDDDGPPEEVSAKAQAPALVGKDAALKVNPPMVPLADDDKRERVEALAEEATESGNDQNGNEKVDAEMADQQSGGSGGSLAALAQQLGWATQKK